MPQWIVVSRSQHIGMHYIKHDGYHYAAKQSVASVMLAELPKLLPHYVLGFIQQEGRYRPVAMLSLDGQNNHYVHSDGRWLGSYVPASLRGYPFSLADIEGDQKALCVDQALLTSDMGVALFDEQGDLTQKVALTFEFLQHCEENRQVTAASVDKLADAGIIEEWLLEIGRGEDQEPLKVNGLYRINEQALNSLNESTLHGLRGGPLSMAYAQLFSMSQINQLTDRAKFHAEHGATQEVPENLDSVFDSDDDLTFDFD